MSSSRDHDAISGEPDLSKKTISNIPDSVKAKLFRLSKELDEDFNLTLIHFASERFLYRLGISEYAGCFVLKGALLLSILLEGQRYRPTRDIDLLGKGAEDRSTERML